MKTAFIIRMHFKKSDPRWSWRLAYFQSIVLPKLLAQTDQDFDICMRVNKHHAAEVQALSDRIKIFDIAYSKRNYIKPGYHAKARRYFVDFIEYKHLLGLERYDIQIGLDSDDMPLRDDFVERIKAECARVGTEKTLHISFQPHVFHVPTLRMYRCPTEYNEAKGSPIFVLYQPIKEAHYVYAYEDSHLKLPRYMMKKIRIEENFCCYSVHDCNSSTFLYRNSEQIKV